MVSKKPTIVKAKKQPAIVNSKKASKSKPIKSIEKKMKATMPLVLLAPKTESKNVEIVTKSAINKKKKYIMPSKSITENVIDLSLQALNKLMAHQNNKNIIFGEETSIFLEIRSIKIQNTRGNLKFVLPHSTVASSGGVCLITPDIKKGRKPDHEPTIEHWEDILRNAGVTEVKTVLPMRQLRVEYDQYELKRRLLTQHDYIMVDNRVLNHVSHLLGKIFFKKHNMLTPVKINEKGDIKKDIDIGLRTSMLRLAEGDTASFLIGHTNMPHQKIKENILHFVKQLNNKFPGGEANIRSIFVKLPLSLSLPLYVTLRPSNSVAPPKLKTTKPKKFVEIEDELSTIPGRMVRVAPDGTVLLKKLGKKDTRKKEVQENEEDSDNFDMEDDDNESVD